MRVFACVCVCACVRVCVCLRVCGDVSVRRFVYVCGGVYVWQFMCVRVREDRRVLLNLYCLLRQLGLLLPDPVSTVVREAEVVHCGCGVFARRGPLL